MRKEAENWLRQSRADFKTAEDCFKDGNYYACAFFCQQAVEKALKGLYIEIKKEMPFKTHNLYELALELKLPKEIINMARELTPEFIISRYPNAAGAPPYELYDKNKGERLLNITRRFFEWLKNLKI